MKKEKLKLSRISRGMRVLVGSYFGALLGLGGNIIICTLVKGGCMLLLYCSSGYAHPNAAQVDRYVELDMHSVRGCTVGWYVGTYHA